MGISAQALLNAMEGITYLVNTNGVIVSINEQAWQSFAVANASPQLEPSMVVGQDLISFVSGEEVRSLYGRIHQSILSGRKEYISFEYRCDAPDTRRQMRMSVTGVRNREEVVALLYQSQLLSKVERPWLSLFAPQQIKRHSEQEVSLNLVVVCSYCHCVAWPSSSPSGSREWIPPEQYYVRGGGTEVRVSHGICPSCLEKLSDEIGTED